MCAYHHNFTNSAHVHFTRYSYSSESIITRCTCEKSPGIQIRRDERSHASFRQVDEETWWVAKRTSITNNFPGRGFHGLRSRSLWWADTRSLYGRPSYLAFVNNLYFTNDVLHPSATYQGIALFPVHTHVTKVCFQLASRAEFAHRWVRVTDTKGGKEFW